MYDFIPTLAMATSGHNPPSGRLNQGLVELYVSCEEALQQGTKIWRSDEAHSEMYGRSRFSFDWAPLRGGGLLRRTEPAGFVRPP